MKTHRLVTGAVSIALALTMVSTSAFAASVKFTDVPSDHWASSFISEMADKGVMSGVGNNKFSPSSTLTGAEFVTMIVRQFYEDKIGASGDMWYSAFMDVAEKEGILSGTGITAEGTISRYDMAQLMYNVLKAQSVTTSPYLIPPRLLTGRPYPPVIGMLCLFAITWACSPVSTVRAPLVVMVTWIVHRLRW